MKKFTMLTAAIVLLAAPLAFAEGNAQDLERVLQAAQKMKVTHFKEIEFENDQQVELEAWLDGGWYVEATLSAAGDIIKEEREQRIDGPWGLSADDVTRYSNAAMQQGITTLNEIKIKPTGYIEIEGATAERRELEVYFRLGSDTPVNIKRD